MPRATVDTTKVERFDLTALPDGFVELRKMTYGEQLRRRDIGSSMRAGQGRKAGIEFETDNLVVQTFEFSHCIVDHNLEDESGKKLNLSNKADIIKLDPVIAQEIEILISKMNNPDEDEPDPNNAEKTLPKS